ncbi:hypothetical protein CO726_25715 [Bacillus fungorum]|uniref:Uncharacterized protein n=2 Tax=Bacillus fungorum TaxID=2039284 RepID=A0A2G6Q7X8_9BACI|nr:hypothetical protein CO726_25715 [Bacillus fungorum]
MDMASGCIMGQCPICEEWVYEDEVILDQHDNTLHKSCFHSRNNDKKIIYQLQQELLKAEKRIEELEKQIRNGQLALF